MSLPDYYKILQVSPNATTAEIKAAYRRLAKIYHPDKSGSYADEERFKLIKEAYENLVDPQRRARYHAKINRATTFQQTTSTPRQAGKKSYSFTEEEAKRRQYYQQHYKKSHDTSKQRSAPPPVSKPPSELKYILISVPVAVALLLLIIRIYEKPDILDKRPKTQIALDTLSDIRTPESPYTGVFGKTISDSSSKSVLRIKNRTGYDAIAFVKNDTGKTVRHHFIANDYEVLAENLPAGRYTVFYWLGKGFSHKIFLFQTILGSFHSTVSVDSVPQSVVMTGRIHDTIDVNLPRSNKVDSALLRKIFPRN